MNWGIQAIVIDSLDELDLLEELAEEMRASARVWLRISPDVLVDTHAYLQTAHAASKFGLPILDGQAGQAIYKIQSSRRLKLEGLHAHLGSQFFEAQPYQEAIHRLAELAEASRFTPLAISPGGGWGVPYLEDQPLNDPGPWVEAVSRAVTAEFGRRSWPLPRLVIEPGRWLVARAGIAVYRVGAVKVTGDGSRYISVDGGMADNPRPALYDARYTAFLPERMLAADRQKCSVVGKYCESGDQLIRAAWLPEARRGDLLAMPVCGAYQLSMASNYNLAPRPAVLLLEEGKIEVLQKREQIDEDGWWTGA